MEAPDWIGLTEQGSDSSARIISSRKEQRRGGRRLRFWNSEEGLRGTGRRDRGPARKNTVLNRCPELQLQARSCTPELRAEIQTAGAFSKLPSSSTRGTPPGGDWPAMPWAPGGRAVD